MVQPCHVAIEFRVPEGNSNASMINMTYYDTQEQATEAAEAIVSKKNTGNPPPLFKTSVVVIQGLLFPPPDF